MKLKKNMGTYFSEKRVKEDVAKDIYYLHEYTFCMLVYTLNITTNQPPEL
jgi:hypothetical protein